MRASLYLIYISLALILISFSVSAQDRVLVIQVSDAHGRPIPGVVLSTKGEGEQGVATDATGKTRIRLAPQTAPGHAVTLMVIKVMDGRDLVFISPWDGKVTVPSFEKESDNFVSIVLVLRRIRQLVESTIDNRKSVSVLKRGSGNRSSKISSTK